MKSDDLLRSMMPQAKALVSLDEYSDVPEPSLQGLSEAFDRRVPIGPLEYLLQEVRTRHGEDGTDHDKSDGWLAPKIHAALRLTRSEAAKLGVWEYLTLGVPEARRYVIWRWGDAEGHVRDRKRICGSDRRHALGRLWWVAELTRNGPDYTAAEQAFGAGQDLINYMTDTNAFHNRAAAIAYARFMYSRSAGREGKKKDAVRIGKALNHVLTTIVLDAIAPDEGGQGEAYDQWLDEEVDETRLITQPPMGPMEPKVDEDAVGRVTALLAELAEWDPKAG